MDIGIGFGRVRHWHDGLGEFSRQLGLALAREAPRLRERHGIALHFHLPERWHGDFGSDVAYLAAGTAQRWLHLRPRRFDLWHSLHQFNRLKAPLGTRHRVETVHDLNFLHTKQGAKRARYRQALAHRLQDRDAVATISAYAASDLREQLPTLRAPVSVIHNGVTDLSAAPRRPIAGLDDGTPFLLHVSRMAPTKNIAALLGLAQAWPAQRIALAGADSPYTRQVERDVAQRGLANVRIVLDLDEAQKAWAYAHCEGFLFPSLAEGFGLPPLEAMCFGKPAFLSRRTSLPEVGGDAACYFDDAFEPQAMRALVEKGLRAAADPAVRARIAAHARSFTWERCADGYLALYGRVLGLEGVA
jgi:glycosyltransferase involved in cell wall biosynthesis